MSISALSCTRLRAYAQITNFLNRNLFTAIVKGLMAFKSHTELSKIFSVIFYPECISMFLTACCYLNFQFANISMRCYEHCNEKASLAKLIVYYLFLFSPSVCLEN